MKTRIIIVAAPSGAGKSSFVERICREEPMLYDTITYTTRGMRSHESQGKPYFFISQDEFKKKISEEYFVEWAQVHNQLYGTPYYQLEEAWRDGKCVIMDVDVQGAETFRKKYPGARSVFILPPNIDELRRRIIKRDGKVPQDIEIRMVNAQKEMSRSNEFDVRIVNDEFESSYGEFKKIVEGWLR